MHCLRCVASLLLVIVFGSSAVRAQGSPPAGCGQIPPVQQPPLANRPWMNAQLPAAERTRLLLDAMNLTEQIRMLYGNDKPACGGQRGYTGYVVGNERLGIPHLQMNDGPQGFRIDGGATTTAWPSGINMAASWDVVAVAAWGRGMGTEFAAKGANVQLGPGLCVNRIPNCGRAFEYLSGEDPFLGYTLAKPVVRAIQAQGVMANAKHWVANSQETDRMTVNEIVDERTRMEYYYPPFAGAIEAGVGSVMCSYNKINGFWSCENNETLAVDLKMRLNFTGFVMSDWEAAHSSLSIRRGLDQEMPGWGGTGPAMGTSKLMARLANATITKDEIAASAGRVLQAMFSVGLMDMPKGSFDPAKLQHNVSTRASVSSARSLCSASTVLLKNENGLLPLKAGIKVAVIGMAQATDAIVAGGGSGSVHPSWHGVAAPLDAVTQQAGGGNVTTFNDGSDINASVTAAQQADVAIIFVGTSSGEGTDRKSLSLDGGRGTCGKNTPVRLCHQNSLVTAIAATQPRTVVVVASPGPVLLPWSGDVAAILTTFMCGEQVGNAVADILYGHVNPSAKLPVTFPNVDNETQLTPNQWPYSNKSDPTVNYTERGLFGYRYYDAHNLTFSSGFAFGHGKSYTSFDYSSLTVETRRNMTEISFTLTNNGTLSGAETAQLYLSFPAGAGTPPRQLKGFKKIYLAPGKQNAVKLPLTLRDLSIWNADRHAWKVVSGTFGFMVGSSSRDQRLTGSFTI